jgi:hypothetical protein
LFPGGFVLLSRRRLWFLKQDKLRG